MTVVRTARCASLLLNWFVRAQELELYSSKVWARGPSKREVLPTQDTRCPSLCTHVLHRVTLLLVVTPQVQLKRRGKEGHHEQQDKQKQQDREQRKQRKQQSGSSTPQQQPTDQQQQQADSSNTSGASKEQPAATAESKPVAAAAAPLGAANSSSSGQVQGVQLLGCQSCGEKLAGVDAARAHAAATGHVEFAEVE